MRKRQHSFVGMLLGLVQLLLVVVCVSGCDCKACEDDDYFPPSCEKALYDRVVSSCECEIGCENGNDACPEGSIMIESKDCFEQLSDKWKQKTCKRETFCDKAVG